METLTKMSNINASIDNCALVNLICQNKEQGNENKVTTTALEATLASSPKIDTNDKFFNQWSLLF